MTMPRRSSRRSRRRRRPPPPPLAVTMAPASQTIGVGGTVVFAVSVSGGVAGEAASWTCASSDPSKATVTMTSAGCAATAVAVGGVTITAAVTKSGATVNTAAGLTITEDTAERATLFITSINDDDEVLSERVSVTLDVERGDQMLMQLSVLVDGVVAVSRTYGGGASVVAAAPEGEEGERAAQQAARAIVLSFNSEHYNTATGEPTYMNGEHTISAELMVASSDEPIESGFHVREFGNGDGVHVTVSGLGEGTMNSATGQRWYGGPEAALEMTAVPVLYSGGSAASVTLLAFCGADAATETSETSFTFTPECSATSNTVAPETETGDPVGDSPVFVIADAEVVIRNDDVFPLYLDYEGPEAPTFAKNPNDRAGGWINKAVDLTGEQLDDDNSPKHNPDGWLNYNDEDEANKDTDEHNPAASGVGGYTVQLRYSMTTPSIVDGALGAAASSSPTLPAALEATEKADEICFIATAVDALGNESDRPGVGESCVGTDASQVIQAGVDITAPTIAFSGTSPKENARELTSEFQLQVKDESKASGLHDNPVLAQVQLRNAKDEVICGDGKEDTKDLPGNEDVRGNCLNTVDGLEFDKVLGLVTTTGLAPASTTAYYTITAVARDNAGNHSEPESRVVLHDDEVAATLIGGSYDPAKAVYNLIVSVTDDFSIRDYYVALNFGVGNAVLSQGLSATATGKIQGDEPCRGRCIRLRLDEDTRPEWGIQCRPRPARYYHGPWYSSDNPADDFYRVAAYSSANALASVAILARDQSKGNEGYSDATDPADAAHCYRLSILSRNWLSRPFQP